MGCTGARVPSIISTGGCDYLGKNYAAAKKMESAAGAFEEILSLEEAPGELRSEALAGLVEAAPAKALDPVTEALTGSDEEAFNAALEYVKSIPGDAAGKAFSKALEDDKYELREESLANQGWCHLLH